MCLTLSLTAFAGTKEPKLLKLVGPATQVEPTLIGIRAKNGTIFTFATEEDLTERVAVGSQVTAWYYAENDVLTLKSIDPPLQNLFVPASEIRSNVKRVMTLPSSDVPGATGVFEAIGRYVQSDLGWNVPPRELSAELLRRARRAPSPLDAIDSKTGEVNMVRYNASQRTMVQRLASQTRVNAVLEIKIEKVLASFHDQVATWDGAAQPVSGKWTRAFSLATKRSLAGEVPAATVVLKLRDPEGKLLWSSRHGLVVLAALSNSAGDFYDKSLDDVFTDPHKMDRWLAITFSSLLGEPARNNVTVTGSRRAPQAR